MPYHYAATKRLILLWHIRIWKQLLLVLFCMCLDCPPQTLKAMKRYCIQTVDRGMERRVYRKEWMCAIVLSDWSIPRPVSRTQLLEEQQSMYVCTNIADRHTRARFGCGRGREGERETNNEWSIISRFSELLQIFSLYIGVLTVINIFVY